MDNNKFIEAIQAFEAGKEVKYLCAGNGLSWTVDNSHIWRSNNHYTITEQPKTMTIETWLHDTGGIEFSKRGSKQSQSFIQQHVWTHIKTETIEVPE